MSKMYMWNYVDASDYFRGTSVVYDMTEEEVEQKKKDFVARGVVELVLTVSERIQII